MKAGLVDQVRFTPRAEYAFHHPLIRAVAYESQLKSDRAEFHRRLAAEIESRDPASADENAAIIAEHLEAAGDRRAAYGFFMRAGSWAINRDVVAARLSWERARSVADSFASDESDLLPLRIAPRTMLCATAWRGTPEYENARFEEFRELCDAAGDRSSLAIGMTGLVADRMQHGRMREALTLADEQMALVESIDDALLTVTAPFPTVAVLAHGGDTAAVLRWSDTVFDWAAGDSAKETFAIGSPLAVAFALRGGVRWWLGQPGWREDLNQAVAIARTAPPATVGFVFSWSYGLGIFNGVLLADDATIENLEWALRMAEESGDDNIVGSIKYTTSTVLMYRDGSAGSQRTLELLHDVRDMIGERRFPASELPLTELYIARNRTWNGDYDGGVAEMQRCVDGIFENGQMMYCTGATDLLVNVLLEHGNTGDFVRVQAVIDRLSAMPLDGASPARDLMVLKLRTLLAQARQDDDYYHLRDRYRGIADSLGFDGHKQWAQEMP